MQKMGAVWTKIFDGPVDYEVREFNTLKNSLKTLLQDLNPDDLLALAIDDTEIFEICQENAQLRQSCIVAAVRRYHTEKFFYEDVYNRTADYMVMLDHFVQIQDEIENEKYEKHIFKFPWCYSLKSDRVGDAAKNGEENKKALNIF